MNLAIGIVQGDMSAGFNPYCMFSSGSAVQNGETQYCWVSALHLFSFCSDRSHYLLTNDWIFKFLVFSDHTIFITLTAGTAEIPKLRGTASRYHSRDWTEEHYETMPIQPEDMTRQGKEPLQKWRCKICAEIPHRNCIFFSSTFGRSDVIKEHIKEHHPYLQKPTNRTLSPY